MPFNLSNLFNSVSITVDCQICIVSLNGHGDCQATDNFLHHHKVVAASETPTSRGVIEEALG